MAAPQIPGWQQLVLQGVGAPTTPQNIKYVNAWAQAEGGGATNNPFNTTQPVSGATSYNSVGVRNYSTPQQGIQATIQTLKNGHYSNILSALTKGDNAMADAQALAASPWGTGSLVEKVLGGPVSTNLQGPVTPSNAKAVTMAGLGNTAPGGADGQRTALMQYLQGQLSNYATTGQATNPQGFAGLLQPQVGTAATQAGMSGVAGAPVGPVAQGFKVGDPVPDGTTIGPLHQTEGLPGYPAHDYFAPAGSPVAAPITGKIVKLSGHDPAMGPIDGPHGPLGWSVYIQGSDGKTYYLTHMGTRDGLKIGQTIKAGQTIGTVANYNKYGTPSHIHMGVN